MVPASTASDAAPVSDAVPPSAATVAVSRPPGTADTTVELLVCNASLAATPPQVNTGATIETLPPCDKAASEPVVLMP